MLRWFKRGSDDKAWEDVLNEERRQSFVAIRQLQHSRRELRDDILALRIENNRLNRELAAANDRVAEIEDQRRAEAMKIAAMGCEGWAVESLAERADQVFEWLLKPWRGDPLEGVEVASEDGIVGDNPLP